MPPNADRVLLFELRPFSACAPGSARQTEIPLRYSSDSPKIGSMAPTPFGVPTIVRSRTVTRKLDQARLNYRLTGPQNLSLALRYDKNGLIPHALGRRRMRSSARTSGTRASRAAPSL